MSQIEKNITVSGKRKSAIAKATIKKGEGNILINNIPYENLDLIKKLSILEPLEIAKRVLGKLDADIKVNVKGGGSEGQIQASRLAIARAIIKYTNSDKLKNYYSSYDKNLLVADTRRKEAYKPGDSKARRKRQKSFR